MLELWIMRIFSNIVNNLTWCGAYYYFPFNFPYGIPGFDFMPGYPYPSAEQGNEHEKKDENKDDNNYGDEI